MAANGDRVILERKENGAAVDRSDCHGPHLLRDMFLNILQLPRPRQYQQSDLSWGEEKRAR